jgi:antitoxin component YwqK of YwqJK toxin-antitoxin module
MLTHYILPDILQFVFNLYIDWENDSDKLNKIVNFNFDIKQHLVVINFSYDNENSIHTYIDNKLSKKEIFNNNLSVLSKSQESNYKNGKYHGKQYVWDTNNIIVKIQNYKNGKKDDEQYTLWTNNRTNQKYSTRESYINGKKITEYTEKVEN